MRIENYSERYFSDVFKIVENFHDEAVGEYDFGVDVESLAKTIRSSDPGSAFLLIAEDESCQGILYGLRLKSPTSGKMMFQEMIWYVNQPYRRHGLWLLDQVEKLLKSQGIGIMIMGVLENSKAEKLKALYERLGYRPMESCYIRNL